MPVVEIQPLTHAPSHIAISRVTIALRALNSRTASVCAAPPLVSKSGVACAPSRAGDSPKRRMSIVIAGPPTSPPSTIPAIAEATAIDSAPVTPASSNSGANARPVAGPPVSVVDPASTPNSGCRSKPTATAMPNRFWNTANALAMPRKIITWVPLIRSSLRLAFMPMVVKKAIISGVCRLVSSTNSVVSRACAIHTAMAKTRPPITGGGRLYLPSIGIHRHRP